MSSPDAPRESAHRSPNIGSPKSRALPKKLKQDDAARASLAAGIGVVSPPPIHVQTPHFEGSLATLFRCVREQKVDLMTVPLSAVCEAYFEYLLQSEAPHLDEAAAALAVLAYLLERKAHMLLPKEESDEEDEEELPLELIEPTAYEYASAIDLLKVFEEERSKLFFRSPEAEPTVYEIPYSIGEVTVSDLARAFERLLRRAEPDPIQLLSKPRRSLQEQMRIVLLALSEDAKPIDQLIVGSYTRSDAVYWFLALLELIRLGQAFVQRVEDDVHFGKDSGKRREARAEQAAQRAAQEEAEALAKKRRRKKTEEGQ